MAYAEAAAARELPALSCTDHAPAPSGYDQIHRMHLDEWPTYRTWVEEAQARGPVPVLFGVEADYYGDCLDFLVSWLPAQGFDLVLGSVHFIDSWAFASAAERSVWDREDPTRIWKRYFELIGAMAETRLYDIAAHLDLPKKIGRRISDPVLKECAMPALDKLAASGMAIEINTSGLIHPVGEMYPSPLLLAWAREREIPLTFGSDAHDPVRVGDGFEQAVALAREVGYTHRATFHGREMKLVEL